MSRLILDPVPVGFALGTTNGAPAKKRRTPEDMILWRQL
jgi:hypothetical protein